MHPNEKLIQTFYTHFQQKNWEGMSECYTKDIQFSDPIFSSLCYLKTRSMWNMLCTQAKVFDLNFSHIEANDSQRKVHWTARYLLSSTGRQVINNVETVFLFNDGKIQKHHDQFHFWKWSSITLGTSGLYLGWLSFLRKKVQQQAANNLKAFMNLV
jgi:hypothetical protein